MDFNLTTEHEMVQKMVRDFAQKEVAPTIKEQDRIQEMAPHVLPRMSELGILGICFPVKYGGQGMDYISLGLVCEELEAVDTTLLVIMSVHAGLAGGWEKRRGVHRLQVHYHESGRRRTESGFDALE